MLANILKSKNLKAIHNNRGHNIVRAGVGKYPEIKELESNSQPHCLKVVHPVGWQIS